MLAHNYNFEGTYKVSEKKLYVFVFEVCLPEYVLIYLVNNSLTLKKKKTIKVFSTKLFDFVLKVMSKIVTTSIIYNLGEQ